MSDHYDDYDIHAPLTTDDTQFQEEVQKMDAYLPWGVQTPAPTDLWSPQTVDTSNSSFDKYIPLVFLVIGLAYFFRRQ